MAIHGNCSIYFVFQVSSLHTVHPGQASRSAHAHSCASGNWVCHISDLFRTNGSDQLGIGVWSIKPTTKLKLFTSKDANLRPADSGKGIYRAYLPLLMCIEGQKVLHNIHISIAECQHIYARCLDGSHITCRVNRKRGAYDQLRSEVFAKTGIPPNMQQLLANRKLVKSSSDLTKNSTLNLKVKLCGGGNCDICYISGSLFICKECEQTTNTVC